MGADPARWRDVLRERGVSEAAIGRLDSFVALQERFGSAMDLTWPAAHARTGRMVLESVAAEAVIEEGGRVLDVGSGNGFPVVPLLIVRADLSGVLLEPRERRWGFLREVARELALSARVERARIEQLDADVFDGLTVRALAPRVWSGHVRRLVRPGGSVCWWAPEGSAASVAVDGAVPVLTLPLLRGRIVVWRRCST